MKKISQLERTVNSAGKAFIGLHTLDVLSKINDDVPKIKIIENLFNHQEGFHDITIHGTQVRVNSLVRIIKEEKVVEALQLVLDSNMAVNMFAKNKARATIDMIFSGEIKIPKLDINY